MFPQSGPLASTQGLSEGALDNNRGGFDVDAFREKHSLAEAKGLLHFTAQAE
jgi:hypothetical protein